MRGRYPVNIFFFAVIWMALLPVAGFGQYFGQNKVRYESPDFKVLKTEHFDIYFYDEEAVIATDVGRMAERWYARLSRVLDHQLPPHQPIILYASSAAFRATTVLPDIIGEGTGGVTEALRRRVILPVAGPISDTDHVLGHELVHAFQYDVTAGPDLPGASVLPLWFVEGMAEYLSIGASDSVTAMWVRDAVQREDLPTLKKLDDPRYFPYRFGQAFWAYVGGTYGDSTIGRILRVAPRVGVEQAIENVLNIPAKQLIEQWHDTLRQKYEPILRAATSLDRQAEVVIPAEERGGQLNVGPVLSPDGSQMIFFSERGLFSIDLYLADARTGKVIRKLTETAVDPHFESLQFVGSVGGWSSDGKSFAFGAISAGRPELTIFEIESNKVVRRQRFPELGEILSTSWSPDGRSIALSAISRGVTDLFILDLESGGLRQLTNDSYADIQPAWSPDGSSLVFSTDRFTSRSDVLSFGSFRLATMNVATGEVSELGGFSDGKNINPEWSPDGRSVYFISDHRGISNIYRISVSTRELTQLTNLATGVAGITQLSPAMSVARATDAIVFSVFQSGNYSIYRMGSSAALGGVSAPSAVSISGAERLPPDSVMRQITTLLADSSLGLPASTDNFSTDPYKPSLALDYVAPAEVSFGTGSFGSLIGGGTALSFSDLLGHHNLTTVFQGYFDSSGGGLTNNVAAVAAYTNQKSRWSWGVVGGQVPYSTGTFSSVVTNTSNGPVLTEESVRYWQRDREVSGIFAFPFNRAQRVELSSGYRNISFDGEVRTQSFNLINGALISDTREDLATPASLNMATAGTALVYDTSIFGGVGPVLGQRYRVELSGAGGSLNYYSFLADYRKYVQLARPVILAGRVLHFGRYGKDSQDDRLQDFFIGGSTLVRGYSSGSFSVEECGLNASGSCPVFDHLVGSRVAIANAELRVPLFGALGVVRSPNIPPVEAALFYDAGVAWTAADKASFLGGNRHAVTSAGASMRFNVLGFTIAQISYVHPYDRPARSWIWEFGLSSAF